MIYKLITLPHLQPNVHTMLFVGERFSRKDVGTKEQQSQGH